VSIRVVTTGGPPQMTFTWDGSPQMLQDGQFISAEPGSPLEQAIGPANLADPTDQQLASAANGGGPGWVSNA
jgi:hypothetical protein